MATQILSVASGAANSADVVVASGSQLTVSLKATNGPGVSNGRVSILLKDDAGQYFSIDELTAPGRLALVLVGAGTYRFTRIDNGAECGVFSA